MFQCVNVNCTALKIYFILVNHFPKKNCVYFNLSSINISWVLISVKIKYSFSVQYFLDMDGNGMIDFEEYVRVLATYCMYSKDEIMRFCFDSFDVDNSG